MYFGVESANQETLNRIGRGTSLEQAVRVFRWKRELGGHAMGSFILGFPWETVGDMRRTSSSLSNSTLTMPSSPCSPPIPAPPSSPTLRDTT